MRYLNILGVTAALALGILACLGASAASATVLCTTNDLMCEKGWDEPAGTKFDLSAKGSWILKSGAGPQVTCTEVTEKGTTENTGGANQRVRFNIESFLHSGCSNKAVVLSVGSWSFESTGESGNATIIGSGGETTIEQFGISCVYGMSAETVAGTFTGGETPAMDVNATLGKVAGGVFCSSTAVMAAQLIITEPKPLWMPNS